MEHFLSKALQCCFLLLVLLSPECLPPQYPHLSCLAWSALLPVCCCLSVAACLVLPVYFCLFITIGLG